MAWQCQPEPTQMLLAVEREKAAMKAKQKAKGFKGAKLVIKRGAKNVVKRGAKKVSAGRKKA